MTSYREWYYGRMLSRYSGYGEGKMESYQKWRDEYQSQYHAWLFYEAIAATMDKYQMEYYEVAAKDSIYKGLGVPADIMKGQP